MIDSMVNFRISAKRYHFETMQGVQNEKAENL